MDFSGLTTVNIELTSRCNKNCWMCGRRKLERDSPELANWGDMEFGLVESISQQLPDNIVVQFHNNGEGLLYPNFRKATQLFKNQIKCLDTNGKLIVEKADEIIDNLDTLTISIFEKDPEQEKQFEIVKKFLKLKGNRKPLMIYRCLGNVSDIERWRNLPGITVIRVLHDPMGGFNFRKLATRPEAGICLDLLNHLAIDRYGLVSPCIQFDPYSVAKIGNANRQTLAEIWNGPIRKKWIKYHLKGERNKLKLCATCDYWGVPTGE